MIPPDFKKFVLDIHKNCSNFNKKVPSVNSEILFDLKNIESPDTQNMYMYLYWNLHYPVGTMYILSMKGVLVRLKIWNQYFIKLKV
jgi:hypothetical protein